VRVDRGDDLIRDVADQHSVISSSRDIHDGEAGWRPA
jgi:hypothetical protein